MRRYLCCLPLLLVACSNLDSLERAQPVAGDYPSSLASEYLSYAQSEKELGHKKTAEYFAAKGLRASKGEEVVAEEAGNWPMPIAADKVKRLDEARAKLMVVDTENNRRVVPQKLARAQLLYDCWVDQSGHALPQLPQAPCEAEFKATLKELNKAERDYNRPLAEDTKPVELR